jgi:hypothetical protein
MVFTDDGRVSSETWGKQPGDDADRWWTSGTTLTFEFRPTSLTPKSRLAGVVGRISPSLGERLFPMTISTWHIDAIDRDQCKLRDRFGTPLILARVAE